MRCVFFNRNQPPIATVVLLSKTTPNLFESGLFTGEPSVGILPHRGRRPYQPWRLTTVLEFEERS
jgi:hypothetical protein